MSTAEVTMYRVVCDYPGCEKSPSDYGDYYAWADAGQADIEVRDDDGWLVLDGDLHYCLKHTVYDEEKDEYVPAPDPQPDSGGAS